VQRVSRAVTQTRRDYPIRTTAGIDAQVFTDFLKHDMGPHRRWHGPRQAKSLDWRYGARSSGCRFNRTFLHDGRASSIEDAVLQHDAQGRRPREPVDHFKSLGQADRQVLLDYGGAL